MRGLPQNSALRFFFVPHRKAKDTLVIDCKAPLWRNAIKMNLQEGRQVDLLNVDYTVDGAFCDSWLFSTR
jgi:hypothetical protein